MTRSSSRPMLAVLWTLGALGFAACGPASEPTTAANPAPSARALPSGAPSAVPPPSAPEPSAEQRKEAAKAAVAAKDWNRAKSELGSVLAKDPNDVAALRLSAEVANAQGDAAGASDALFQAAKADGCKDEALVLAAAQGLWSQRRHDDLVALANVAVKVHGKSMPTWMYLGMAQSAKGDFAGAVDTYGKLTAAFGDEPQLWAELALAQVADGKADAAKASAKTALEKWALARDGKSGKDVKLGKGPEEIARIARALRRAGDAKAAEGALGQYAIAKDEAAPWLEVEKGFARLARKDGKGARAQAEQALKVAGEGFAPARLLLAGVAAQAKKADEAKGHLSAYDAAAGDKARLAWERKWVEDLLGADASKPTAAKATAKPDQAKPGDVKGSPAAAPKSGKK